MNKIPPLEAAASAAARDGQDRARRPRRVKWGTCMWVHTYICIYTYMYIVYIYIYIHTLYMHIHIYIYI